MPEPLDLSVLFAGDGPDAGAVEAALRGAVREVTRVATWEALRVEAARGVHGAVLVQETFAGRERLLEWLPAAPRRAPVLVLLAEDDEEAALACLRSGAADVLAGAPAGGEASALRRALARARARRALQDARAWEEERYRLMVEHTFDMVSVLDGLGRYVYASPSIEEKLGYRPEDLLGQSAFDALHPDDREAVMGEFLEAVVQPGTTRQMEYRVLHRDGSVRHFEGVGRAIAAPDGQPYGVVNARDVTARKAAEATLRAQEAALRQQEHFLRQVVHRVPVIVFALDAEGRITYGEGRGLAEVDAAPEHLVGRSLFEAYAKYPDILAAARTALAGTPANVVATVRGRTFDAHLVPVHDAAGRVARVTGVAVDVTEMKAQQDALERSRAELRALAAHLQDVREEERTRISREVHDVLGQQLTAIRLGVGWLARRLDGDAEAEARADDTRGLIDETIQRVRHIAAELRPGVLDDLGLASAVEWYAERFGARAGLPCRVTVEGADEGVPPEAATAVFRIFQEALTNAARHARATAVEAHLAVTPEGLSLRVRDDGVGLAPETLEATRTLGLLGMRERARALGGRVEIESAPGAGTCVSVRVPLPASDGTAGPVPAPPA